MSKIGQVLSEKKMRRKMKKKKKNNNNNNNNNSSDLRPGLLPTMQVKRAAAKQVFPVLRMPIP
jgi:hypothetical protein